MERILAQATGMTVTLVGRYAVCRPLILSDIGFDDRADELWPRVGDGLREGGGVSWGVTKPPGLQARSDTP